MSASARRGLRGGVEKRTITLTVELWAVRKHLAARADCYNGLCVRIVEIYSCNRTHCDSITKYQKCHRGVGCCVATIEGIRGMFAIALTS